MFKFTFAAALAVVASAQDVPFMIPTEATPESQVNDSEVIKFTQTDGDFKLKCWATPNKLSASTDEYLHIEGSWDSDDVDLAKVHVTGTLSPFGAKFLDKEIDCVENDANCPVPEANADWKFYTKFLADKISINPSPYEVVVEGFSTSGATVFKFESTFTPSD